MQFSKILALSFAAFSTAFASSADVSSENHFATSNNTDDTDMVVIGHVQDLLTGVVNDVQDMADIIGLNPNVIFNDTGIVINEINLDRSRYGHGTMRKRGLFSMAGILIKNVFKGIVKIAECAGIDIVGEIVKALGA